MDSFKKFRFQTNFSIVLDILNKVLEKKHKTHTDMSLSFHTLTKMAQAKIRQELERLEERIKEDEAEQAKLEQALAEIEQQIFEIEQPVERNQFYDYIGAYEDTQEFQEETNQASFEEKREKIERYDVRGKIIIETAMIDSELQEQTWLHLSCKLGVEDWLKLYDTSA